MRAEPPFLPPLALPGGEILPQSRFPNHTPILTGKSGPRINGTKDRRPELKKFMDAARYRQLDAVVVWRYGRLARSVKHLVNTLSELWSVGREAIRHRAACGLG